MDIKCPTIKLYDSAELKKYSRKCFHLVLTLKITLSPLTPSFLSKGSLIILDVDAILPAHTSSKYELKIKIEQDERTFNIIFIVFTFIILY